MQKNDNCDRLLGDPSLLKGADIALDVIKEITIKREKNTYGFTVTGNNYVYVQSVKKDSAADISGVKYGDCLLKINKIPVFHRKHKELVDFIKAEPEITLTLIRLENIEKVNHQHILSVNMIMAYTDYINELQQKLEINDFDDVRLELECADKALQYLKEQFANNKANSGKEINWDSVPPPLPSRQKMFSGNYHDIHHEITSCCVDVPPPLPARNPNAFNEFQNHLHNRKKKLSHKRTSSIPASKSASRDSCILSKESHAKILRPFHSQLNPPLLSGSEICRQEATPPGTPPPAYRNKNFKDCAMWPQMCQTNVIIPDDDDGFSEVEEISGVSDIPFSNINILLENHLHLAIFSNYLFTNNLDPSNMFFLLITNLYKERNVKEMRKWAYEIQSTFLLPDAPLHLDVVDESMLNEIDHILLGEIEHETNLRTLFNKIQGTAKKEVCIQLQEFCKVRTVGLSRLYEEGITNEQNKEMIHIERLLLPHLETRMSALETNSSDRVVAEACSLATILLKTFNLKTSATLSLLERCPTFISREKSLRSKWILRGKKHMDLFGHHFVEQTYFNMTLCHQCRSSLWGISPQGYQCTSKQNLKLSFHRNCIRSIEEACVGAIQSKKGNELFNKLIDSINLKITGDKVKKPLEDKCHSGTCEDVEISSFMVERQAPNCKVGDKLNILNEIDSKESVLADKSSNIHVFDNSNAVSKKSNSSISRSESYRERIQQRHIREKRKNSDPNLSKTQTGDVSLDNQSVNSVHSGSSSNSSLSQSLESPLESSCAGKPVNLVESSLSSVQFSILENNSDLEVDADAPDWQKNVDWDLVDRLPPKERKRQDVINEFFHTERTYVRSLKVLESIFYIPMRENQLLPTALMELLFSNLEEMLELHSQFSDNMRKIKRESPIVKEFQGERFKNAAAQFCQSQAFGLDMLKARQRRDNKLSNFLSEAEANPLCRRLKLRDIIPMGMQRLTKYPLLLENLVKYTSSDTDEHEKLVQASDCSKEILNFVNQAVKETENNHRFQQILKRLDRAPFDKVDDPDILEFKNKDLSQFRMLYDGSMIWHTINRRCIDVHIILFEEFMMLLHKQDDRLVLKCHLVGPGSNKEEKSQKLNSPIIKYTSLLVRHSAADKKRFFIIINSSTDSTMYELEVASPAERKIWLARFAEVMESFKQREFQVHSEDISPNGDVATSLTPSMEDNSKQKDDESGETSEDSAINEKDFPSGESQDKKMSSLLTEQRPKIEIRKVAEDDHLIEPSEIRISQDVVLTAEPVLTQMEQMKRTVEQIDRGLIDLHQQAFDMLYSRSSVKKIPIISSIKLDEVGQKGPRELIYESFNYVLSLQHLLKNYSTVTDGECMIASSVNSDIKSLSIPIYELLPILTPLGNALSSLLQIVAQREEDYDHLRRELNFCSEQIQWFHHQQLTSERLLCKQDLLSSINQDESMVLP